jgi:hypothetical protein
MNLHPSRTYQVMNPPSQRCTEQFHCPSLPSSWKPLSFTDSTACLFQNHTWSPQHESFVDWLLSLSVHLQTLHVFPWFGSSLPLVLNDISSKWTMVYLSVHLLKDVLTVSKFCQWWIKLPKSSMCRFCVEWILTLHKKPKSMNTGP